jgi:hypothetical protein
MSILGFDKHAAGCKPGSVCTFKGTGSGRKPGSVGHGAHAADAQPAAPTTGDAAKKMSYLEYARSVSYAMEAKAEGQQLEHELFGGRGRVQSVLGGAMLRMYLDGKRNPDTVAKAGKAIGEDEQFHALVVKEMNVYLQAQVAQGKLYRNETDKMRLLADQHLRAIKNHRGIDLRKHLNAVIGGVGSIAVESVRYVSDASTVNGMVVTYRADIRIGDTYNFHGHRTGEQAMLRTKLAHYLAARDYNKFEATYNDEASFGLGASYLPLPHFGSKKTHLDDAGVFACFMYALEDNHWTTPLDWDVVIPVEIKLTFSLSHASKHSTTDHRTTPHTSSGHK